MAKVNLKPLGGNIIVKPVTEKSVAGIVLPDTVDREKPQKGEVIALGKLDFYVKVGDIILFKKYSPDEIDVDGEDYLIMDEDAVLAILPK